MTRTIHWLIFFIVLNTPLACFSSEPTVEESSNLFDLSFSATETSIGTIPIKTINPAWQSVLVLRKEIMPKWVPELMEREKWNHNPWEIVVDLNGDGNPDKVVVGVFQTVTNEFGRFVLILTQTSENKWKKIFLQIDSDKTPGYTSVHWDKDKRELTWHVCSSCDVAWYIKWDGKKYVARVPTLGD